MPGRIVVGICTYKRPKMLKSCLESLACQQMPGGVDVTFFICNNDGSDADVIKNIVQTSLAEKEFVYHVESKRGIVPARNAIVEYASKENADYIAFIDDDEVAKENWLVTLYNVIKEKKCDAVHGVVRPLYPDHADLRWVEKEEKIGEGCVLKYVGTGNVIFSRRLFTEWNLRFDERYNMGGGEDIDYFMRSAAKGGVHIHTNKSVAEESVPDIRITPLWQLRRKFSDGVSVSKVIYRNKGRAVYIKKYFIRSLVRSFESLFYIVYGFVLDKELMIKHLKTLYYSLGCLYFAFGLKYMAYKKTTGC